MKIPVSVKIRTGWDCEHKNAPEFAKMIEGAGASMIAIHGRTRSQLYSGHVDLDTIKKVKSSVSIPVIGNGDIKTPQDAKKMMEETGCDGVMIARGGIGNPWLFTNSVRLLENNDDLIQVTPQMKVEKCLEHAKRLIQMENDELIAIKTIPAMEKKYKKRGRKKWLKRENMRMLLLLMGISRS